MNRRWMLLFATVLVMVVVALDALATQVIQRTPKELAQDSQLVVDGKVASVRSYWNEDGSKIFTEAVVTVAATHKGGATQSVRVVQPGGVVGITRMTAHGALQWKPGEEVLLFLEPSLPGAFQVAGFSQGKFLIERDASTGKAFVKQAMPPDRPDSRMPTPGTQAAAPARLTLEQFLDSVLPSE